MKTSVLKKLGLGVSAFACLMTMGVQVHADDTPSASTSVSFSTIGNSGTTGGGTNGNAQWYVTLPKALEISKVGEAVTGQIKITTADGGSITDAYTNLLITVEVTSANEFSLKGVNNESNTVSYSLTDVEGSAKVSEKGTGGKLTSLLGTGSGDSGTASDSITISALIENSGSTIATDTYRDTLIFKFTEDTGKTVGTKG